MDFKTLHVIALCSQSCECGRHIHPVEVKPLKALWHHKLDFESGWLSLPEVVPWWQNSNSIWAVLWTCAVCESVAVCRRYRRMLSLMMLHRNVKGMLLVGNAVGFSHGGEGERCPWETNTSSTIQVMAEHCSLKYVWMCLCIFIVLPKHHTVLRWAHLNLSPVFQHFPWHLCYWSQLYLVWPSHSLSAFFSSLLLAKS